MARSRNPRRDEAFQLWTDSGKTRALKDIAAELGVSEAQVRKWKCQDRWSGERKVTLPNNCGKSKGNVTKSERERGGQLGNKNAAGHGAPPCNKNSFKHGAYEELYWDALDEDERCMIEAMQFDEDERMLIEQIQLLTVRERRLMRRIKEKQEAKGGLALDSVISRKLETAGNLIKGNKQTQTETTTRTISTFEVVLKLEAELTKVQARKTRCIESLAKLRNDRLQMDKENDATEQIADIADPYNDLCTDDLRRLLEIAESNDK